MKQTIVVHIKKSEVVGKPRTIKVPHWIIVGANPPAQDRKEYFKAAR